MIGAGRTCITAALGVLCSAGGAGAEPSAILGPIIEITEEVGGFVNTFAEHGYSMHNGKVVWRADGGSVYLYTGSRPPAYVDASGQPAIHGNTIVMAENHVSLLDTVTLDQEEISPTPAFDRAVIHGRHVAWSGHSGPQGTGVFLYDGQGVQKVSDETSFAHDGIALDDQRLVWVDSDQGLNVRNLANGMSVPLNIGGQRPDIDGNYLVFQGLYDDPGIFLVDLSAAVASATRISAVGTAPSIDGDHIVFSGSGGELRLYSIAAGESVGLGLIGNDPILSGGYLVWGDGVDLFITTVPEPVVVTPLAAAGLLMMRRIRWRRTRRSRGDCAACGYGLRAAPHRCPECGRGHDSALVPQ